MWKTKELTRENGSKSIKMICQNSKPNESKWGEYAPEDGPCTNWNEVGPNTAATLCWQCVARSVSGMKN